MIDVKKTPSGLNWYVLDYSSGREGHRDTAKTKREAEAIAEGLRDGSLVYDAELGHTVPANPEPDGDPLAAMLAELE